METIGRVLAVPNRPSNTNSKMPYVTETPNGGTGDLDQSAAWLFWLTANNLLDHDAQPGDRATPELIAAFVTQLAERIAPVSVAMIVAALLRMMVVLSPDTDWTWFRYLVNDMIWRTGPLRLLCRHNRTDMESQPTVCFFRA